jgi:hypothetical protein
VGQINVMLLKVCAAHPRRPKTLAQARLRDGVAALAQ